MRNETKMMRRARRLCAAGDSVALCWAISGLCLSGADHQKPPAWVVYTLLHRGSKQTIVIGGASLPAVSTLHSCTLVWLTLLHSCLLLLATQQVLLN